jgi:hypothetical protein
MLPPPEGTARSSLIPYAYFVSFYRRKKFYASNNNSKESILCSLISDIVTGCVLRAYPMVLVSQGTGCALSVARRCSPGSSGKPTAAYACRAGRTRRGTPGRMSHDHGRDRRLVCPSASEVPGSSVHGCAPQTSRGESAVQNLQPVLTLPPAKAPLPCAAMRVAPFLGVCRAYNLAETRCILCAVEGASLAKT